MLKVPRRSAPVLVAAFWTSAALAHHSFAANFDSNNVIEISGTLTSVEIRSPHSFFLIDVRHSDGVLDSWEVEAHSTAILRRTGITAETLQVGDPITIRGPRGRRTDKNLMFGADLQMADGRLFQTMSSIVRAPKYRIIDTRTGISVIERFAGRWLSFVAGGQRIADTPLPLNTAGRAAREGFDPLNTPGMQCVPPNIPSILYPPYLYEIVVDGNDLILHHEYYDVERPLTVGAAEANNSPPAFGQRHGRLEDNSLIVESIRFPPMRAGLASNLDPIGNGYDIPSSAEKRITERYTLNEDGGELTIEYTLEDPTYLAELYTSQVVFHRVPNDTPMYEFPCDADISRRSTLNAVPWQ